MTADTVKSFGFPTVSTGAAREYEDKTSTLVAEVDAAMLSRVDLAALVGPEGKELMRNNHKNHAAFISLVLRFNRFDILHDTLPWVYRTSRNQGFSYDYFPNALGYWMDATEKTLSKDGASEILPVYRRIIELHNDSIQRSLDVKPVDRLTMAPKAWRGTCEKFRNHLLGGDLGACVDIAGETCRGRENIMDFFLWVLQPSLYWIGDLWERGAITVAQEHLSTAIAARVMSGLTLRFRGNTRTLGRAMVFAVTDEHHEVGAWMVADCLETDGWEVACLGSNVPLRDTITHITSFKPHIIALSVTMPYNLSNASKIISRVKGDESFRETRILLGGLAFTAFQGLPEKLGADGYGRDCREAVDAARRLWNEISAV